MLRRPQVLPRLQAVAHLCAASLPYQGDVDRGGYGCVHAGADYAVVWLVGGWVFLGGLWLSI